MTTAPGTAEDVGIEEMACACEEAAEHLAGEAMKLHPLSAKLLHAASTLRRHAALVKENETLREEAGYAVHQDGCRWVAEPCSCGLNEVRRRVSQATAALTAARTAGEKACPECEGAGKQVMGIMSLAWRPYRSSDTNMVWDERPCPRCTAPRETKERDE